MVPSPHYRFLAGGAGVWEKDGRARHLYDGDIARCSLGGPGDLHNEDLLYKLFGINAELLILYALCIYTNEYGAKGLKPLVPCRKGSYKQSDVIQCQHQISMI